MAIKRLGYIEKHRIYHIIIVLICVNTFYSFSQGWRFPNCGDLVVTKIEFMSINHDSLLVSVYNNCDTCEQHVYTGLIAYSSGDTLAMTDCITCYFSPPNNDKGEYYLFSVKSFETSEIDKIQMTGGICDSIPFSFISGIKVIDKQKEFNLSQNYPNPFNPVTTIVFNVPHFAHIELVIYNLNGQIIKRLVNDQLTPGTYSKKWNGTNQNGEQVGSGLYIYKLISKDFLESRKLLLLK